MWYPKPYPSHNFYYKKKQKKNKSQEDKVKKHTTDKQYKTLKKYQRLRKHLPYIKHVYLCDSMSFNAHDNNSDIDLFFITKAGCTRRARFWTVLIFWMLGIKRSLKKKSGLFDLIFYVDENHDNMIDIAIKPEDIYLSYRLAHLIPIYQSNPYNIYNNNKRIKNTLPNFPMKHVAQLDTYTQTQNARTKKLIERIGQNIFDNLWESIRKHTRKPLVIKKKARHKSQWRWIIINDHILKFHKDKRKAIQQKRKTYSNTNISDMN